MHNDEIAAVVKGSAREGLGSSKSLASTKGTFTTSAQKKSFVPTNAAFYANLLSAEELNNYSTVD